MCHQSGFHLSELCSGRSWLLIGSCLGWRSAPSAPEMMRKGRESLAEYLLLSQRGENASLLQPGGWCMLCTTQSLSLFGEAGGSGQKKVSLSNKDGRVWKEMEAEGVRWFFHLPSKTSCVALVNIPVLPECLQGESKAGSTRRGFDRIPLCISCSEMAD